MAIYKDLLQLVFLKLDYGHDMLNFSEINHGCYQIFHQQITVIHDESYHYHSMVNKQGQQHGLERRWDKYGQLRYEINYFQDYRHKIAHWYHRNGELSRVGNYLHGFQHGLFCEYHTSGRLEWSGYIYKGKVN